MRPTAEEKTRGPYLTLAAGTRWPHLDNSVAKHQVTAVARRMLPEVTAIRYSTPLREGGSVPGVVEADDLGTCVAKFIGAAQGRKTLIAEVVSGELARRLGLRVLDLVRLEFDPVIALGEPDEEVQDVRKPRIHLDENRFAAWTPTSRRCVPRCTRCRGCVRAASRLGKRPRTILGAASAGWLRRAAQHRGAARADTHLLTSDPQAEVDRLLDLLVC